MLLQSATPSDLAIASPSGNTCKTAKNCIFFFPTPLINSSICSKAIAVIINEDIQPYSVTENEMVFKTSSTFWSQDTTYQTRSFSPGNKSLFSQRKRDSGAAEQCPKNCNNSWWLEVLRHWLIYYGHTDTLHQWQEGFGKTTFYRPKCSTRLTQGLFSFTAGRLQWLEHQEPKDGQRYCKEHDTGLSWCKDGRRVCLGTN